MSSSPLTQPITVKDKYDQSYFNTNISDGTLVSYATNPGGVLCVGRNFQAYNVAPFLVSIFFTPSSWMQCSSRVFSRTLRSIFTLQQCRTCRHVRSCLSPSPLTQQGDNACTEGVNAYTEALIKHLMEPEVEFLEMLGNVEKEVKTRTRAVQNPVRMHQ